MKVVYHSGCADGFCAAWLFHKAFPDAEYIPASYGDEPVECKGQDLFLVDFSYRGEALAKVCAEADTVTILDHHVSEEKALVEAREKYSNLCLHFDNTKSGGRLAQEFLQNGGYLPKLRRWLVDYTEDRDLWRWQLPNSRAVSAWLASVVWSFEEWDNCVRWSSPERGCIREGEAILRYQAQEVEKAVSRAKEVELGGSRVLCVNTTTLHSEVGEALCQGRPFAITYFISSDGFTIYSLRSREGGADVSQIAKQFGGGGHKRAAGFKSRLPVV
jgi:oligoribonuclease NrnB/cAMP/cGMP phosphodiesterase (DHH superfamily)